MPVVVTGGDLPLGRAVVAALLADGVPEVRATVACRAGQRDLLARGVRTALVDWADVDLERLGAVLQGAHTVIHLAPAPVEVVLAAAQGTGVRRLVVVGTASQPDLGQARAAYDVVVVPPGDGVVAAVVAADRRR